MVHHGVFYHAIRNDIDLLRDFIARMSQVLSLFARLGVVHADLKPDNILIEIEDGDIKDLKLIDFGSAFYF